MYKIGTGYRSVSRQGIRIAEDKGTERLRALRSFPDLPVENVERTERSSGPLTKSEGMLDRWDRGIQHGTNKCVISYKLHNYSALKQICVYH
jgi:hypothetical protein